MLVKLSDADRTLKELYLSVAKEQLFGSKQPLKDTKESKETKNGKSTREQKNSSFIRSLSFLFFVLNSLPQLRIQYPILFLKSIL